MRHFPKKLILPSAKPKNFSKIQGDPTQLKNFNIFFSFFKTFQTKIFSEFYFFKLRQKNQFDALRQP